MLVSKTLEGQKLEKIYEKLPNFRRDERGWSVWTYDSPGEIGVKLANGFCTACQHQNLGSNSRICKKCLSESTKRSRKYYKKKRRRK